MPEISVLVIDDHAGFRRSTIHLLQATQQFKVVGEASNSMEGLTLAHAHQPDVVLVDIRMPGMNGLTIIGKMRKAIPNLIVVVLTLWDTPEYRQAALIENGADAYIIKENMFIELVPTLERLTQTRLTLV